MAGPDPAPDTGRELRSVVIEALREIVEESSINAEDRISAASLLIKIGAVEVHA